MSNHHRADQTARLGIRTRDTHGRPRSWQCFPYMTALLQRFGLHATDEAARAPSRSTPCTGSTCLRRVMTGRR